MSSLPCVRGGNTGGRPQVPAGTARRARGSVQVERSGQDGEAGWIGRLSRSRRGIAALSAAESTVVPIPLEAILIPLMLSAPRRALGLGLAALAGCVAGALLFYALGFWLFEPVVSPALEWLGWKDEFRGVSARLTDESSFFTAVLLISLSPIPMQIATLGAGAVHGPVWLFVAAIALSRGLRYLGLAALARLLGARLERMRIPRRTVFLGTLAALGAVWLIYQGLM